VDLGSHLKNAPTITALRQPATRATPPRSRDCARGGTRPPTPRAPWTWCPSPRPRLPTRMRRITTDVRRPSLPRTSSPNCLSSLASPTRTLYPKFPRTLSGRAAIVAPPGLRPGSLEGHAACPCADRRGGVCPLPLRSSPGGHAVASWRGGHRRLAWSSAGYPDLELGQDLPEVALHFLWKPTRLSLRRSPPISKRTLFLPA